jgi:hypothetical protein
MKPYLVRTPRLLKALYNQGIWHIKEHANSIYLTFDDGPHPQVTPFVLDQLKTHQAKGTFFCIGKNVESYPKFFNVSWMKDMPLAIIPLIISMVGRPIIFNILKISAKLPV